MKCTSSLIALLLLALSAQPLLAQSGYDLFQQALVKERAEGNAEEALALYERVGKEYAQIRALAARALLQQGLLYEKLGREAEAQQAFQVVVSQYADQMEIVRQARARITVAAARSKGEPEMSVRQVWAGNGVDVLGAPSPDGRYLSFIDWETGDLAVRDLATGTQRRVTKNGTDELAMDFAYFSVFSRDGKRIAYAAYVHGNIWRYELRVIDTNGANHRKLYNGENEYVRAFDWSPDGSQILVLIRRADATNQIALISALDGSVRPLKTLDWRYPIKMSFSPDGHFIAYDLPENEETPERDIYVLSADASREVTAVIHPANDFLLGWTPDGQHILFASDRTGNESTWMMAVADGKAAGPEVLIKSDLGRQVTPLGMTQNGTYYFGLQVGDSDVYTITWDAASRRLGASPAPLNPRYLGGKGVAAWSPDGSYIAYLPNRTPAEGPGAISIVIRDLESGQERRLAPRLSVIRTIQWSPDGRQFVAWGNDEKGRNALSLIDVETGAVTTIPVEPGDIRAPGWMPDGRSILYRRNVGDTGLHALVKRDLQTGAEQELVRTEGLYPGTYDISPDGRQLAFHRHGDGYSVLSVIPLEGGAPREILRLQPPEAITPAVVAWTPDGKEILFAKKAESDDWMRTKLWRVPVEGGEPQPLEPAINLLWVRWLQFSPDGRRLLFTAGAEKHEVWAMENFLPVQSRPASQPQR